MRRMRSFAKRLICIDFWLNIGSYAVEGLIALVVLVTVIRTGTSDQWVELVAKIVGTIVLLGFVWWVAKDAKKASKKFRQERLDRRAHKDVEAGNPTILPERPPWMG